VKGAAMAYLYAFRNPRGHEDSYFVIFVALVDHAKIVGRLIRAMRYDYSTLALLEVFIAGAIAY